jgi:Xaa-Pro aminopeptidase
VTAPPPIVPFPRAEFEARWERLQRGMVEEGLDGLLITSQTNFEYVTGYRTPAWMIRSRPMLVLLPVEEEPTAIVSLTHAVELEAEGLIDDLYAYDGFEAEATVALLSALRDRGLAGSRLGIEAGLEQRLGIPLGQFRKLKSAFPGEQLPDGSGAIWRARMIKSEAEIARLRVAGRIAGEAYARLLSRLAPGWTERHVYQEISQAVLELGGESPGYVTMTAGKDGYHRHNGWPGDRCFEAGELFWMDLGATFQGYFSDYTRCASMGPPTQAQRDAYQLSLEMLDAALSVVRSGAETGEPVAAAAAAARRAGAELRVASRIGHGVGLDITEPPSLARGAGRLEEGMVLAVEPGVLTDHGWYHLEENVVVRGEGCEFLSARMPRELPVAGLE